MEEERAPTYSREKERHNIDIDINENIAVPKHSVAISNSINGETKAEVGSRGSEPEVRNIVQSTKYSNNENGRQLEENLKINDEDDYSRNRHGIAKGTDDKTFKYEHMNAGIDQTQAGKPSKLFEMLSREFDDDDNNKLGNYELSTNIPLTVDTEIKSEISTSPMCSPAMTSPRSMTSSPSPEISPRQIKREISESSSEDKDKSGGFDGKPKKKSRRRGSAWSDEETEFLMEIWAREVELVKGKGGDITATCAPVYRLIAQEMTGKGYDKSWEQCKTRIHTLKRAYKITKDEINSGAKTITYCRHFDKLGIICLDNPDITPGVLATTLAQKREKMEAENKTAVRTPVKRKLIVGEPPVTMIKRQKQPEAAALPSFSSFSQSNTSPSTDSNSVWLPPLVPKTQQPTSALQMSLAAPPMVMPTFKQPLQPPQQQHQQQTPSLPPPPSYHYSTGHQSTASHSECSLPVTVKPEMPELTLHGLSSVPQTTNAQHPSHMYAFSPTTTNVAEPVQNQNAGSQNGGSGNPSDIERMKLDLELRKLDVERKKIEMEERQRREERDHQYRMLQLLLFGLGQQSSSQGSEVALAHLTTLSRALENGLVPGGQGVNEKGLSFNEL